MISKDLRIQDIDAEHFTNLFRLMNPPTDDLWLSKTGSPLGILERLVGVNRGQREGDKIPIGMPAVALVQKRKVVRVFRLGGGTMPPGSLRSLEPSDLRTFRKEHGIPFLVAVDIEALPQIWADMQREVKLEDDLMSQYLCMLRIFQKAMGHSVWMEPRLLNVLPWPSYELLQMTFNHVLPDGKTFVFYLVNDRRIWTSLIVGKRAGDIWLITTHKAISHRIEFSSIREIARQVLKSVSVRFGPPHVGVFLPLGCWAKFVAGDRSAIAIAMASRNAIVDPAPPWFLALIGAGVVTEAASRSVRLAGKLLANTPLRSRFLSQGAERLVQNVINPLEALGLDPWEIMNWGRRWTQRIHPLLYG
ncbi:MAG: hypothetical protein V1754_09340 [Pseudomonadota bacterium]